MIENVRHRLVLLALSAVLCAPGAAPPCDALPSHSGEQTRRASPRPEPSTGLSLDEADRLLIAGEYGRAAEGYRRLAASPEAAEAKLRLAATLLKREDAAGAMAAADAAVEAAADVRSLALRSLVLFRRGRFEQAGRDRDRATVLAGLGPARRSILALANARLLASLGYYGDALEAVETALEGDGLLDRVFRAEALFVKSDVLDELGRPAEAVAALEAGLAASPRTNDLLITNLQAQIAFRRSTIDTEFFRMDGTGGGTVPLRISDGLLLAKVAIGGSPPAWFIVDTGAGVCIVFSKFAKEAGVKVRPEAAFVGAIGGDGRVELHYGLADRVAVGEVVVRNVPVGVIDWKISSAAGIIGLPLLRLFTTTFDYRAARLRLDPATSPQRPDPAPPDAVAVPFRYAGGGIYVETTVNGRGPFNFELDTGASPMSVPVDVTVAAAVGLRPNGFSARRARGSGAAGGQEATLYAGARLSWGGLPAVTVDLLSQPIASSRPERRSGESGLTSETETEGLLGYGVLRRSVLTIDFPSRRLWVRGGS